jgi:glucokinase
VQEEVGRKTVSSARHVIGVDVGGTKILAGVIDADGKVQRRRERKTSLRSEEHLIAELEAAVEDLLDESIAAIGFGLPSRIDSKTGVVQASVNIPLEDVPLRDLLQERFDMTVEIENDGNAATLAESRAGAGREAENLVMLTLGTGCGGGVVIDGKLLRDGGELGHTVLVYDGIPCQGTCTGRGHLEAYVSGTAATKLARDAFGPAVDAHRLVRIAAEGDSEAIEILAGIGRKLGAAIGSFVNIFRPELVVVGGGFAAAGDYLLEPARETMLREALPPASDRARIVRAELGTSAGMIGAALVAFDAL